MFGTSLFVATCLYCKCTKRKYRRNCCGSADRRSEKTDGRRKASGSNNHDQATIRMNAKRNEQMKTASLNGSSDEDDNYYYISGSRHIPKKVFRKMHSIPRKKKQASTGKKSKDIPEKVFKPMLKIPKSFEIRQSLQTGNQPSSSPSSSSSSLLKRLLKSNYKAFQRSTGMTGSIVKRNRFIDAAPATFMSAKKAKSLIKVTNVGSLNSSISIVPPEKGSVELGRDEMEYIDVEGDDPDCCRNRYTMKRGFRYLFNQDRVNSKNDVDDMGTEQKRGFFQKFFHPTSSRSLIGDEGTSSELERRQLLHDDDGYAIIDRQQDDFIKEKREMSAPLSPKSVTFEDELFTTATERRGQSVAPRATFLTDSIGAQQTYTNFNYDLAEISAINSKHNILDTQSPPPPTKSNLSDREYFSSIGTSRDASLALDEATHDLLRLSSQPASVWYSSSSRLLPAADRIPKSASTTSMNKVIRTKDGGMLKLSNVFTWNSAKPDEHLPRDTSTYVDEEGRRHRTVTIYTDKKRKGPPIVRTTVEGKLNMKKVVGADLITVEHCMCSSWTIRDTITHYKVKTTLGNRTLIMEEETLKNSENREGDFKMSLYDNGQLKTREAADFQIPPNVDKANYLSMLSQRLLRDIETLENGGMQKTTTRIEVEVTEDVTKILKTYVIGERNDLLKDQLLDQTAVDATDEFSRSDYQYEVPTSSYDFSETKYIDVLEKEPEISRPSSDIKFLFEGHHYKDQSEIRSHKRVDSDTTTISDSLITHKYLPTICVNIDCELTRTEDSSLNEVNVAVPNVFSAVLSLIRERVFSPLPNLVHYGMEQHGKQYSGETTIRRLHRFESTESEELKKPVQNRKEPSFFFEKPQIIEPVKIPVLNITELDLRRKADTSAILANFAIPRTDQSQLDIERSYEIHEAQGRSYGMEQQGQYFKGEMIIKKNRQLPSESESISDEEIIFGQTYLNFVKQEARGEFEVAIVISNDQRTSPKHFQQAQSAESINLIAQISTDGKKEEVVGILAMKMCWKEVYKGQEMTMTTTNLIITIQKSIHLDDIFQQNTQNWNEKKVERIAIRCDECAEEQAQILVNLASPIMESQQAYCIRAIANLLQLSLICGSAHEEDETVVIYMENKLTTAMMMACNDVRCATRFSGGHLLKTKAATEETALVMLSIEHSPKYANDLVAEYNVKDVRVEKIRICSRESYEIERTSNVSLNRGSKILAASTRLLTRMKENDQMTIAEFGDAREHVAVLLQRAGVVHGQVEHEWPDAVTADECKKMNQAEIVSSIDRQKLSEQKIRSDKSSETAKIRIVRIDEEMKKERGNDERKMFVEQMLRSDGERVIPIQQIPVLLDSSNFSSSEQLFADTREQYIMGLSASCCPTLASSSTLIAYDNSNQTINRQFKNTECVSDRQEIKEAFRQSNSWLQRESSSGKQWPERRTEHDNMREMPLTWNELARSCEQQCEFRQECERMCLEEFLSTFSQQNRHDRRSSPIVENRERFASEIRSGIQREFEEMDDKGRESMRRSESGADKLQGKLYNATSETRVAMLNAGFDLDTTLLATPEAEMQSTFAKDHSVTTSEYFSDERSWSTTTESYYKLRETRMERISRSFDDVHKASMKESAEELDEISHTFDAVKYSRASDGEMSSQMTRSLTTSLDATALKEFLVAEGDEFSNNPEATSDVRKFKEYQASSLSQYQQKRNIKEAPEILTMKKKGERDTKIEKVNELSKEYYDFIPSCETTSVRQARTKFSSIDYEKQHEIFQSKMERNEYVSLVNSKAEISQIPEHKISCDISKISDRRAFSPTAAVGASVSSSREMTGTDETISSGKNKQSERQISSETALLIQRDLSTTLQTLMTTAEETEREVYFEEADTQFDAVMHFPIKHKNKSLLQAATVTEEAAESMMEKVHAESKLQSVKERQHTLTQFETVECQVAITGTFRDSEFLEEMKQLKATTEKAISTEQELLNCENEDIAFLMQRDSAQAHEECHWIVEEKMVRPEVFTKANVQEAETEAVKKIVKSSVTDRPLAADDEQISTVTDYRRVICEESVNKNVEEKNLKRVQMMLQTVQAESIDNSDFFANQEALSDTEIIVESGEYESIKRNLAFSEKQREEMLSKLEEKVEHTVIVKIPDKQMVLASAPEYSNEVTSGLFQQITVQDIAEKCTKIIAEKFRLQVSFDVRSPSSEDITQDIILEAEMDQWNVGKVFPEVNIAQEYLMLQSSTENFVTQQSSLEKSFDNYVEVSTCIRSDRTEQAYAIYPEIGYEQEALTTAWSKILRKASTEISIPVMKTEQKKLLTKSSTEKEIEFSQMIEKMESSDDIEQKLFLRETADLEKQLTIVSERREQSLFNESLHEASCTALLSDLERSEVEASINEFATAQVITTGSFARLEQQEMKEKAETQIATSMKLESCLDTQFAGSEFASLDKELKCDCDSKLDEIYSVVEKPTETVILNVKAANEEANSVANVFETQEEHLSNEFVFPEKVSEAASSSAIQEFGNELQQYMMHWDAIQNSMSAEAFVAIAELKSENSTIDAIKEENVQIDEEMKHQEFSELMDKTILLKPYASETGEWKIVQETTEAIFQHFDEQIAGRSISIEVGFSEKQSGIFREYSCTSAEAIIHFAKILMKKFESYEAKISNNISRQWEECLNLKASEECFKNLEQSLVKVEEQIIMDEYILREVNQAKLSVRLAASSETLITFIAKLQEQAQDELAEMILKDRNREWIISKQFAEESEVAKQLEAIWSTTVNDFDTSINICESNHEQAVLNTTASQELQWESESTLYQKPFHENASALFPSITAVSGGERQFKIESEMKESILTRQQEELFAESMQRAVSRAEGFKASVTESSEVRSDAEILLMRRSTQKVAECATHVVGVVLTLEQQLKTQHAQEISNETCVEFSIPASDASVEDNIRNSVVNRDVVSLETTYAKATALEETVKLTKSPKVSAEAESILKGVNKDAINEKLKEADSEGFEILSQWTTVDRDLEAEIRLQRRLNVASIFSTVATCEEEISISEKWTATEAISDSNVTRSLITLDYCQRDFQIECKEVKIRLEKSGNEESCEKLCNGKNYEMLHVSVRESTLKKLNAVINLHRISNTLPKQSANEYIWHDQEFIRAIPLYVKCEHSEANFATVDILLEREVARKYLETVRVSANWIEAEIFECEQAGDEKFRMVVELQGKQPASSVIEALWPEARKTDNVIVDMEESFEDQIILYTEITSERLTFADATATIHISQEYEPQFLTTIGTKEEIINEFNEFGTSSQSKDTAHVIIIGNRGEYLSLWLQEAKENFITIGFQYSEEEQAEEMIGNFVEKRFGGNYQLITKATQTEDRSANVAMLRRIEDETVREILMENVKDSISVDVLASESKATLIDVNWEKAQVSQAAFTRRFCSRKAEPIKSRFLEIGETIHTVYAEFKVKQALSSAAAIWKIPNYGGHLKLDTESAEEVFSVREIEHIKNETFETIEKRIKQAVTTISPILSVKYATEEIQEVTMDWIKPAHTDEACLLRKQANKGVNIVVKLIETMDVKESNYVQFAREAECLELEKIIREVRFGGKFSHTTNASEENELSVIRELTSSTIRVSHCTMLLVAANFNRGTHYETIATKSESTDIPVILRKTANIDGVSCTIRQKSLMRNVLTMQESEANILTINLNYSKERAKEISEKTIRLARNGGSCTLTTFATTDEQKLVQWILEKRRDTILCTSARIPTKSVMKAIPLCTMESEFLEITVYPELQHIVEMLEVSRILVASNRYSRIFWKLHEMCEENEYSNYHFKQENMIEYSETIVDQPRYGGYLVLSTSATKQSTTDAIFRLETKLLTEAEVQCLAQVANKSTPVMLSTKSAVSEESNQLVDLKRNVEIEQIAITQKAANTVRVKLIAVEISVETGSITVQYRRNDEYEETKKTILLALYGGHQKLETSAAVEIIADVSEEIVSKHPMFAQAQLHLIVATAGSPVELSTESSKVVESNQEYHLKKEYIFESDTALTLRAANCAFAKSRTAESSTETEMLTTHWQREEKCEEARLCMMEKRYGGIVLLTTNFAQESVIMFTVNLTASRSNFERIVYTLRTARYSSEQPILTTTAITEFYDEVSCHLNRPSVDDQSTITIYIANQIGALIVQLTESTIISETINMQYQRQNAVADAFSEVLAEARFGGSLILNTSATEETFTSMQCLLNPQDLKQLTVQLIFTDKNHASQICHFLATTEQFVTASVQLQKDSDSFDVVIVKCASREGDNQRITFAESSEINEFSNFLWKNPTEISAGQIITLKEIYYGGHVQLNTKHASEQTITFTDTLRQTLIELGSGISRKTANRGESVTISCSASQENQVFLGLELQSKKVAYFEISTIREASNHETPQKLITNESSELILTTNIALQKSLEHKSTETILKAKYYGGIIELECNASWESYVELHSSLESSLQLKQHAEVMLIIDEAYYGEHLMMNLMATEETIFNLEVSFEKQNGMSKQTYTAKEIGIALPEVLETVESLESAVEIGEMEVQRRVSEMHVESALKLARQCLPVSLKTDSAEETFIRHEAEMRVNVERIDGTVEIEKSERVTERELLTCAENVDVTLRHKSLDEEQEEKVEKRVSFAAEVTEKTMSMDMNVTVEHRELPSIVKKPMKKEHRGRRPTLRQNEAPNFVPVRRNSLVLAMELGDAHNIPHYKTLEDVIKGIKKAGLEYSNLIFGIDYTKSNKYQGERTFDGRNLHDVSAEEMNPYQQVIDIVGKTLSSFDADGVIPTYGFGDEDSRDQGIFNLHDRNDMNAECNGFEEVLRIYTDKTPSIRMSGPTNFVPLIEQAVSIVREKHSYHILVIVADGQVTNEKINQKAIAAASRYPLSIIMVGVGDGPWNMMTRFDETLPKRMFDNFHFVDFHKVMFNAPNQEASFAFNALLEIPDQYKAIKELGLLKHSRRG